MDVLSTRIRQKSRHGKCIGGMAKNVDLAQTASETSFGYSQLLKIERE